MKIRNLAFAAALIPSLVLSAAQAFGQSGEDLYMKKTCYSCHGKDAKTTFLPMYPKLAGQNADFAYTQMLDIKSGARSNGQAAAMKGIMHLVNEEEMRAIADWLATLE